MIIYNLNLWLIHFRLYINKKKKKKKFFKSFYFNSEFVSPIFHANCYFAVLP